MIVTGFHLEKMPLDLDQSGILFWLELLVLEQARQIKIN